MLPLGAYDLLERGNSMEQWKTIKGYEDYEVSDGGHVRNMKTGKILKPCENKRTGYYQINLSNKNGKKKFSIHRLVAIMWIPNDNPEHKTQVNHINEDKTDNRVENLEWVSPKENINHGTCQERRAEAKRGTGKKIYCYELDREFDSETQAEEITGIAQQNISACCHKRKKTAGKMHWKFVD